MSRDAPLAVTMGDPAGCGPQITTQAWRDRAKLNLPPFYVIAHPALYADTIETCEISAPEEAMARFDSALPVLPLSTPACVMPTRGLADAVHAAAIIESIETATDQALQGAAGGVVTNPISKAVLYAAGFQHPGHTEFIAALCRAARPEATQPPVMMLVGGGLRVALMTIHMPLNQVASAISQEGIQATARTVDRALKSLFGIQAPKIGLAGLNPHAGESGTIGDEEIKVINPAAQLLRAEGVSVTDARPGDTIFYEALSGDYDAVIAMTHDQGLIPVKTLDFWGGVNTTLGLPIIRTSPDHGTAYEAAAAGTCRNDSLVAAIRLADTMATARRRAHD